MSQKTNIVSDHLAPIAGATIPELVFRGIASSEEPSLICPANNFQQIADLQVKDLVTSLLISNSIRTLVFRLTERTHNLDVAVFSRKEESKCTLKRNLHFHQI